MMNKCMIHRFVDRWLVGEYQQMGNSLSHSLYKERSFFGNLQCLHPRNEGGKEKRRQIKKVRRKANLLLGYQDSNLEKQDQNLLCYHYTISQSNYVSRSAPCRPALGKGWDTRTRTWKNRTRICCVTITPYPNFPLSNHCFCFDAAKVRLFLKPAILFPTFFQENYFSPLKVPYLPGVP